MKIDSEDAEIEDELETEDEDTSIDKNYFEEDEKVETDLNINTSTSDEFLSPLSPGVEDNIEPVSSTRKVEKFQNSQEIIRQFTKTEISEINQYISTNVPFSVLNQFFLLSERPIFKAQIYTGIYRIVQSASRYVGAEETRAKLRRLLRDSREIYFKMYGILSRYQNASVNFNRHRLLNHLEDFFLDPRTNTRINKLIDAFLVFAEKQELMDLDRIVGLDLESEQGIKVYKDLNLESVREQ